MIETRKYTTIMSQILKPKKVGNFELVKKVIPKGMVLNTYDSKLGRIYKDKYDADFPVVMLKENLGIWMSDAPFEQEGIRPGVKLAKGDVLICGLGIGLLPTLIAHKPEVKWIDIVEINLEVINLVYTQLNIPRPVRCFHEDAWNYLETTEYKYDFIHIDIWSGITAPLKQIDKAIELAQRCLKPVGEIRCWLQELYERIKEKLPKEPMHSRGAGIYEPCLICSKTFRHDYAGLCMDCADVMGVSDVFIRRR